jgi:two-component system invasion response regulator UvrY
VKILIADDHVVLRRGLIQVLSGEYPDARFGESSTTSETLERLSRGTWDVLVLDIFMPGRGGLEVLHEARRLYPKLPVLVISSAPAAQLAVRVLRAGASGYLNKRAAAEELVNAVTRIRSGHRYLSAEVAELLAAELGHSGDPIEKLSDREFEVLRLLLTGKSIKEIAQELSLSGKTVSTFHVRLWEKLRVRNDVELVRYAIESGLTEPKEDSAEG